MNISEYIASGILEDYALGIASKQERKEVECLSHIYPEIKAELVAIQSEFEKIASINAIEPPKELKSIIIAKLEELSEKESKVISLSDRKKLPKDSFSKWLAAAGIALVIGFAYLASRTSSLTTQLTDTSNLLEQTKSENEKELSSLREKNSYLSMELNMFRNPMFISTFLTPTENRPQDLLSIVCWNKNTNEIHLSIENMPPAPSNMQFQLWAIIDGSPVDLGVFDTTGESTGFVPMKKIESGNPQAFAITLEEAGGKPTPNLKELYVIGKL
ncbi:MAG: anti-sigma factor domain-containing protein [Flavobacteriales bacterium]